MQVNIAFSSLTNPAAVQLVQQLNQEIQARYSETLDAIYFNLTGEEIERGRGAFALARVEGKAVGCGAVRLIDETTAELKRMYVVPDHRRNGIAAALLRFLEDHARTLGVRRILLETVTSPPAAVALYRAAGYDEIPKFGPYVDSEISYCMGRALDPH